MLQHINGLCPPIILTRITGTRAEQRDHLLVTLSPSYLTLKNKNIVQCSRENCKKAVVDVESFLHSFSVVLLIIYCYHLSTSELIRETGLRTIRKSRACRQPEQISATCFSFMALESTYIFPLVRNAHPQRPSMQTELIIQVINSKAHQRCTGP